MWPGRLGPATPSIMDRLPIMDRLLKVIDFFSRLTESLAVILIFGYCGLMLTEIIARGFLGTSLPYSWEYSTYAMAGIFFLAAGPAIRTAVHVRISLLTEALPDKAARLVDLFANLIALIIVAVIVGAIGDAALTSLERGTTAPTVVRTPLFIPQVILLIGAAQLWLDLFARFARRATGRPFEWRKADAPPEDVTDG